MSLTTEATQITQNRNTSTVILAILTFLAVLGVLIALFIVIGTKDNGIPTIIRTLLVICVGIGGIWAFFWAGNNVAEKLGGKKRDRIVAYFYVFPAVFILAVYLVYPAIRTIILSFFDRTGSSFVALENYRYILENSRMLTVLRNTFLWVLVVPLSAVTFGLIIAVLVDRLSPLVEKICKAFIFMPMAVSFVGAGIIFRFVYYKSPFGNEIGLLNAVRQFFEADSIAWLIQEPWNNFFLMLIMIWLQTGFAMVILSSAIKNVPGELHEAARIDGAHPIQIFFRITIPYIKNSIIMVLTTILFLVLKAFDIVFVMTSGDYNTDVIASAMYDQTFQQGNFGRGSALAVLLFIIVVPFVIQNVKNMREQGL